ncbi:hypothetical protein [Kitasatospora sp. NPDC088783]|uniref:hypothetical protein n=1 Tax=Kitasatospora sp. NPDC088783 TaxID=3364077 RepID=UPI00381F1736
MADKILGLERVEVASDAGAVCIVRCLQGTVSVGDIFHAGKRRDSDEAVSFELTVESIWRYGQPVEFVDAPHGAKVRFLGASAGGLGGCSQIADGDL